MDMLNYRYVYKEDIMKLRGVTIDFDDRKTCGLLPELCLTWDERSEELEDNRELLDYWKTNLEKVLKKSKKVVTGNLGTKSILYAKDQETIELIKTSFKELVLDTIEYDDIIKCENCLEIDYFTK